METWAAIGRRTSHSSLQGRTLINTSCLKFTRYIAETLGTLCWLTLKQLDWNGLNVISCNHFSHFLSLFDTFWLYQRLSWKTPPFPLLTGWLLRALLSSGLFHGFPISSKRFLPHRLQRKRSLELRGWLATRQMTDDWCSLSSQISMFRRQKREAFLGRLYYELLHSNLLLVLQLVVVGACVQLLK